MQDFRLHLDEQIDFLESSIAAYDGGKEHEAKRLAVPIRTLVHNTRHSTSLLRHLQVQRQLGFVDRGPPDPPPNAQVIAFGVCVVEARLDTGESRYASAFRYPAPDRLHPPVSFEDWWRRPILHDLIGNHFSRADLVLALANKDGGAHIDASLEEKYRQLTRENSLGVTQDQERPMANSIVQASVRHIAEELLASVVDGVTWDGASAIVAQPVCPLPLGSDIAVGRNDLCQCGSGKKSKLCFGRRQPLRVMRQPPADSKTGDVHPIPGAQSPPAGLEEPPSLVLDCLLLVPVR
jgi:hypothetical protein